MKFYSKEELIKYIQGELPVQRMQAMKKDIEQTKVEGRFVLSRYDKRIGDPS